MNVVTFQIAQPKFPHPWGDCSQQMPHQVRIPLLPFHPLEMDRFHGPSQEPWKKHWETNEIWWFSTKVKATACLLRDPDRIVPFIISNTSEGFINLLPKIVLCTIAVLWFKNIPIALFTGCSVTRHIDGASGLPKRQTGQPFEAWVWLLGQSWFSRQGCPCKVR